MKSSRNRYKSPNSLKIVKSGNTGLFLGKGHVEFYVGIGYSSPNVENGILLAHTDAGESKEHYYVEDFLLDLPSHLTTDKIR